MVAGLLLLYGRRINRKIHAVVISVVTVYSWPNLKEITVSNIFKCVQINTALHQLLSPRVKLNQKVKY